MTALAVGLNAHSVDQRVLRAQSGDLDAFNELVLDYESLIYRLCYGVTRQKEVAEDAAQETFASAWRSIGRVSADSFRPWLCRIAINASKTQLRKRRHWAETTLDAVYDVEAYEPTPEQASLSTALRDELGAALSQLPGAQRDAIVLWHHAGFNYNEIAAITGSSAGTVKSRLFRGRQHLSRLLSRDMLQMA